MFSNWKRSSSDNNKQIYVRVCVASSDSLHMPFYMCFMCKFFSSFISRYIRAAALTGITFSENWFLNHACMQIRVRLLFISVVCAAGLFFLWLRFWQNFRTFPLFAAKMFDFDMHCCRLALVSRLCGDFLFGVTSMYWNRGNKKSKRREREIVNTSSTNTYTNIPSEKKVILYCSVRFTTW